MKSGISSVQIGEFPVGPGKPVMVIAEIGINHNGDLEIAKKLIDVAMFAGCNAVKFQKRTPELCVPIGQRDIPRETPWGAMSYLDYRKRIELSFDDYVEIDEFCRARGILWFASCWDEPSVQFMAQFKPACFKVASASITDENLLSTFANTEIPVILSSGMSTLDQIDHAISVLDRDKLMVAHTTSTYPCPPDQLNLRMIPVLEKRYQVPIGYSGHESGLQTTVAAVVLGADS